MATASGISTPSAGDSGTSAYARIAEARLASKAMQQRAQVATPRASAPFVTRAPGPVMPHPSEPAATVTLDKIGDFLELDFRRLFVWLRAGLVVACLLALAGGIIGGAYAMLAKHRYTVATDILINPANLQVVANDLYAESGQVDGQLLNARSKQRILTSRNVLARVVDELDLANDPEFVGPDRSGAASGAASDPKLAALKKLADNVGTTADETSFVTTLSVSSETTGKAILISQAVVKAFQEELAKAEATGAGRAAAALDSRLGELKSGVQAAEEKVQSYRRSNNLSASNGQLVSSQAMTQLNSQIVEAQSRVIAAQASYDALVAAGVNGGSTDPSISPALAALRDRADALRQQIDAQSMTFGPRHPTLVRLKAELDTVGSQIRSEFNRTVETANGNLEKAKAALAALGVRMNELKGTVFTDNDSEVALRELERDAASKTAIYESFLSRARQITEREQIDTTNVQVISTAVPPMGRSWPPRTVMLVGMGAFAGFALGMMLSIGLGILRDMRQPPARQTFGVSQA